MNKCPICGKPTASLYGNERKDLLCKEHATMFKKGLIKQCDKCGTWHDSNEPCPNCSKEIKDVNITKPNSCLICGNETTDGYHLCKKCYQKYKNKEVIIKIDKCSNIEILDAKYINKEFISEDGHTLKSKDETLIDNYLYNHGILHSYEKKYVPNNPEYKEPITPDFYIPNYKDIGEIYIEYWGVTENKEYEKQKEYKLKIYKEDKITLIQLTPDDLNNLSVNLERKLKHCKKFEIN